MASHFSVFLINGRGVEVVTDSQCHFYSDALIGADGIHSRVRTQLWGECPIRKTDYICWRGIVTEPCVVESIQSINELWGKGARFGYMRCSPGKVYWFATRTVPRTEQLEIDWQQSFVDWPNPVGVLLKSTAEDRVIFSEISDRKPIFPWSRGPVTLLGDAAHPMTPNFGQGGAQAIEDAVVLSRALAKTGDPTSAFRVYESHRNPRTKIFVTGARQFGRIAQGGNWLWQFLRKCVLPRVPKSIVLANLDKQFNFQSHLLKLGAMERTSIAPQQVKRAFSALKSTASNKQ